MSLADIKHIVLVLSGKGGVGKSSITTQLALTLSLRGHSVGVLDVDLTGPSMPRFFGLESAKVTQAPGGWLPVVVHEAIPARDGSAGRGKLSCMSLGFLLADRGDAVVWRGPKKTAMVRQFLTDVLWDGSGGGGDGGGLDYLLVDTPPGTSDEHISLVETLLKQAAPGQLAGAVVVTTPQAVSVSDVRKEINFCAKTGVRVLGVVENMAGFVCPHCAHCTDLFSRGGGEAMARDFDLPFLGTVPIDPMFVRLIEDGTPPVYPQGTVVEGREVPVQPESNGTHPPPREERLLVEKYARCSLWLVFDVIVDKLLTNVTT